MPVIERMRALHTDQGLGFYKGVFKCLTETANPCELAILKKSEQITKKAYEFAEVLMHTHLLSYIQLKLLFEREDKLDSWEMWT